MLGAVRRLKRLHKGMVPIKYAMVVGACFMMIMVGGGERVIGL